MAENKKSIVEEALADMKLITEALKTNAKGILLNIAKEEIDGVVNESLNEDMYDEEDVEDTEVEASEEEEEDTDVTAGAEEEETADTSVPAETDLEAGTEAGLDVTDLGTEEGGEDYEAGIEDGGEDYEIEDLTGSTDDDVISVYQKLTGTDKIEIVSDKEVIIKDDNGSEYNVKFGNGAPGTAVAGDAIPLGVGTELGDETPSLDFEPEAGMEAEVDLEPAGELEPAIGADDAGVDTETEEDELGEGTVYEVTMGDEDATELSEDIIRGDGHDKEWTGGTLPTGEIEGQTAPEVATATDNDKGGFKNTVGYANAKGPMIMGEEADENPTPDEIQLESLKRKYNKLLGESKELLSRNKEYEVALKSFRQKLGENVVFSANLASVVKLFTENSTTSAEKASIVQRFDKVKTLQESKTLYKNILSDLSNKSPLRETIENKLAGNVSSGKVQISESTVYVDPSMERIKKLMNINN